MPAASIFSVGIDLGTSHTVVASVRLADVAGEVNLLPIAQRVSMGEVSALPLLPSVRYQAGAGELGEAWEQPWPALDSSLEAPAVIGRWARELGSGAPARAVVSAKSWLSHAGVDRTAPILPWGAADDEVHRISPLRASASYLAHVRQAWDEAHPQAPLVDQQIVLTVPASFDEGARALTLEAARLAGLPAAPALQLLEEPKAAFADWLGLQGDALVRQLADSRLVLVVDVGGGTTDLTLIRVEPSPTGDLPILTRVAVGEHLMLGGDNMDLALAHHLEPQFTGAGQRLSPVRFAQLVQRCRQAKETLLAADAPESVPITLLGSGSRLLGQSQTVRLTREEAFAIVVDGFMPEAVLTDEPRRRQGALRGLGLPYPADAAISRHLAAFLALHATGERPQVQAVPSPPTVEDKETWDDPAFPCELPDAVMLNGGVFHADALVQRLTALLTRWRGQPVRVLHNPHPDWAVARGAALQGWNRHRATTAAGSSVAPDGGRPQERQARSLPVIGGGSPRSYWLALPVRKDEPPQGVCLLPRATPEGAVVALEGRRFLLRLGQAVRFGLLASSQGQHAAGQLQSIAGDGFVELPELSVVLPASDAASAGQVEVSLQAAMTELGTLEVRCVALDGSGASWQLAFAVRGSAERGPDSDDDAAHHALEARLPEAMALIDAIFGERSQDVSAKDVRQLRQSLEKVLGARESWPLGLLRAMFDALLARARRRRRSPEHERVWFNLAGWCLRPGVGAQLDDWRLEQVWSLYEQSLAHGQDGANWTEWWVFWRRVAAGLGEDRQMIVLEAVAGAMQKTVQLSTRRSGGKAAPWGSYDDMLRLFAAMEAVPWPYRQEMGQWMLQRLKKPGESPQTWWAIGRLATRQPLAANAHLVMPPQAADEFLQATLAQDWRKNEIAMFAAVQIARLTGDRSRDLSPEQRAPVVDKLRAAHAPERWLAVVESIQTLDAADQKRSFGDSLPPGLVML